VRVAVDRNGSESCPMAGLVIRIVEPSRSAA
jgi:hypothetical protein